MFLFFLTPSHRFLTPIINIYQIILKCLQIRVSLKSSTDGIPCMRSYLPRTFGRKSSTLIELNIASTSVTQSSPIFFLHADDDKFIALEMVERRIRLVWNLGGTTETITHPLEITYKNIAQNEAWYLIKAQQILNTASLTVRRMNHSGNFDNSSTVYGSNQSDFNIFHLSKNSRIWLGGVPTNDTKFGPELVTSGLGVVIQQIKVDRYPIGLWNTASSIGQCQGEISGPKEPDTDGNSRYFNGDGYALTGKISSKLYRKTMFAINLSFKTMDENALIFLAVDENNVSTRYK